MKIMSTKQLTASVACLALIAGFSGGLISSAVASPSSSKSATGASKTKDEFPSLHGRGKNTKGVWVHITPAEDNDDVVKDFVVTVRRGMKLPIKVRLDSSVQGSVVAQEWLVTKQNQRIRVEGPEGYCTTLYFKSADKTGKTGLTTSSSKFYFR